MKYYKKTNTDGTIELLPNPIVKNHIGLEEITEDEFSLLLAEKNAPTVEDEIAKVKVESTASDPVAVEVTLANGTVQEITFNGGDSSASAISGAVQLSTIVGESTVKLWDVEDELYDVTLEEATRISVQIATVYRDAMYARQEAISAIRKGE